MNKAIESNNLEVNMRILNTEAYKKMISIHFFSLRIHLELIML